MLRILLVGVGGFLGSIGRYLLGDAVHRAAGSALFPYGTLAINGLGCLGIGLIGGLAETRGALSGETRAFLMIGVLGGFTTFSTFGYETFQLLRDGQALPAVANVVSQAVLGVVMVWAGYVLARIM